LIFFKRCSCSLNWFSIKQCFIFLGGWGGLLACSTVTRTVFSGRFLLLNRTILAKLHYYELLDQNLVFDTFGSKLHFLAKIPLLWNKITHFLNKFSCIFSDALLVDLTVIFVSFHMGVYGWVWFVIL